MHRRPTPPQAGPARRRLTLSRLTLYACVLLAAATGPETGAEGEKRSLRDRLVGMEIAAAHPPLDDPPTRSAPDADHMRPDDVSSGWRCPAPPAPTRGGCSRTPIRSTTASPACRS